MRIKDIGKALGAILFCQLAGIIGSLSTSSAGKAWYATIQKPWFTPPSWVFAPVWTTLYVLMGIALYLVLKKGLTTKYVKRAIALFGIQLGLNTVWSPAFFSLKNPLLGLIVILFLIAFLVPTIYYFYKIRKEAGLLLIPYIVWVGIATALNYSIWIIN